MTSPNTTSTESRQARFRRVHRPWRVLAVVYIVALEVGTHWPRLRLGTEEFRVSDKLLHTAAFAAGCLLLWRSGWTSRPRTLLVIGLAWALLNELTQALPGLGRTTSLMDAFASAIGVVAVVALIWAFEPIGSPGGVARQAQRRRRWALEEGLGSWKAVAGCAAGALILAPLGAVLGGVVFSLPRVERPVLGLELGALLGLATGGLMAMEVFRRSVLLRRARSCFECGAEAADVVFDSSGHGACEGCGAPLRSTQWEEPPWPPSLTAARLVIVVLTASVLLILIAFLGSLVLGWLAITLRWSWLREVSSMVLGGGGPERYDMDILVEFLWLALIAAVCIRGTRRVLAAAIDGQHRRCLRCRFDLRGSPASGGRGRCPECGQGFIAHADCPSEVPSEC